MDAMPKEEIGIPCSACGTFFQVSSSPLFLLIRFFLDYFAFVIAG
jgi:hypothetical protein